MTILNEFLLFACMAALVTGIVLAAASLVIREGAGQKGAKFAGGPVRGLAPIGTLQTAVVCGGMPLLGRRNPMATTTPEMPLHIETAYKDAVDNIIFNKKQQWVTTNYALLVYAAIFVVSANFFSRNDMVRALLGILTLLTFLYHMYMLKLLQDTITSFESRLEWIYRTYFTTDERTGLKLTFEPKPYAYQAFILLGLIAVSVIGAALTEFYLFSVRN
jgi:hypothetical protein